MKKQYFVEQLEGIVYVDPAFLVAAGQIHTEECSLFETLKRKYPTFKFEKKNLNKSNKTTYFKLTYARMKRFIETNIHDEAEIKKALAELKQKRLEAEGRPGQYAYVKSWFLSEYKDEYNKSSFAKEKKEDKDENTLTQTENATQKEEGASNG
ncbi:MAG: hypothetical protein E7466_01365 [Ruminococcaceae bacterium]|nr:hypothetical protein [Oscillospiraceae bacterium]